MQTLLELSEPLIDAARKRAEMDGTSLDTVVEEALRAALLPTAAPARRYKVRAVHTGQPTVELTSLGGLLRALDEAQTRQSQ